MTPIARLVGRQDKQVGRVSSNLIRVQRGLALPAQEHGVAVLVVEGDQDGGGGVEGDLRWFKSLKTEL